VPLGFGRPSPLVTINAVLLINHFQLRAGHFAVSSIPSL
jgi:hypothetical protein